MADGAVLPRRALRRLGRLSVLRGRPAGTGRRGGSGRATQGGRDAADHRRRRVGPLGVGARLEAGFVRRWPGMASPAATAELLERASAALGRPILAMERGGASDASHVATRVPLTIDGLGPRGGGAHAPQEYVLAPSLRERAEVALAIAGALLDLRT